MEEKVNEPIRVTAVSNSTAPQGTSNDTKIIVTVILLVFFFPVGLILMWFWTKWPRWLKILLTVPLILTIFLFMGLFAIGFLAALNPNSAYNKGKCVSQCENSIDRSSCIQACSSTVKPGNYAVPTGE